MSDMIKDSSEGISFVCNHIAEYGGDPNRIYLMGQSAGAHIAACSLLEQAIKEAGDVESTSWSVSQLKAYFGLSGGYNLFNLVDHFHSRGLYPSIFLRWFAKRFMHPAVVSLYDYIFLWDEDLGVENFHPRRYLKILKSEGLEISQPALGPNSTEIHHKITARVRTNKFHRRVWDVRGSAKCTEDSEGPPCTGFVEGMAPVFSRSAWHCAWHLIQSLLCIWSLECQLCPQQ